MSQHLILLMCLTLAACNPMPAPRTGQRITGLCASSKELEPPLTWQSPPSLKSMEGGNCPFPEQANQNGIDYAEVLMRVLVSPTGVAQKVRLLADAGYGFGETAANCALAAEFGPAQDSQGAPIQAWTPAICIRFSR